MSDDSYTSAGRSPGNGSLLLAGVVFIVAVAAFVVLEVTNHDTDGLLVLVGPVVAALLINGQVRTESAAQNRTLRQIESQTNGALTRRDDKLEQVTRELVEAKAKAAALEVAAAIPTPSPGALAPGLPLPPKD